MNSCEVSKNMPGLKEQYPTANITYSCTTQIKINTSI